MKCSVLGVGTELTSGQILNRNGWWISQRMKDLGLTTSLQLVVPDDRNLILEALRFSFDRSDFIFVTGGLGPTSDDFTRDLICEFTKSETFFDDTSWEKVTQRLKSRNLIIRDFQRQQCFFPIGSQVLRNANGTADGFHLPHQGKHFFVLPGPPSEIEGIWNDHLSRIVQALSRNVDKSVTHSWDILGQSESEVASRMEPLVESSGLEIAYRVHLPFVEFKLTHLASQNLTSQKTIERVDQSLTEFDVARNGLDWSTSLGQKMRSSTGTPLPNFLIVDELSGGYLLNRLLPHVKSLLQENRIQFISRSGDFLTGEHDYVLQLSSAGERGARFEIRKGSQRKTEILKSPGTSFLSQDREKFYFAEKALIFWNSYWS